MKKFRMEYEESNADADSKHQSAGARFDHFGFLAPFYEFFIPPRTSPEFIDEVDFPKGGMFLDAGGGTGRVAQFFQGQSGLIVVADESSSMLQEAVKKSGLCGVCAAAENLPFFPRAFDRVVMVDALHHVADQAAACGELWRIIKPGGRIVVEEPDIRSFWVKLIALAEKLALMRSRFLSPPQIAALFHYPGAEVRTRGSNATALIVINKTAKILDDRNRGQD